ncbi:mechanosensitive ion channel family protein [Xinfangfangia sp. D13-10-4-6]|uniref:mechanosensitive ion channel family protein n=1 Tax=Pseudogemmobacter hezensis TaxID=2737662 RepID=UPI001555B1E5|nr:mechanosensitive ion channel family protein [Pseudogemmobacter hezensis]NPD15632.1 mechanosensitive ion channel family protein [Pseudogemmobacter hezensis]
MSNLRAIAVDNPWIETIFWLALLLLAAAFVNYVVKVALVRILHRLIGAFHFLQGAEVVRSGVIARIANAAPALVISVGIVQVPGLPAAVATVIGNVANAFIILVFAMAISAALGLFHTIWNRRQDGNGRSIKGYVQVATIAVYGIAAILMVAAVIDRSPMILLSGLGALTAVLILVFQDTLLSLVASVQISSTDMVKVGDWIEMPAQNADGDVIEIALHTVKVQNWDKTITTVPIRNLVTQPFKNWRGMQESGGRRIKRAINIDQNTIRYLTDDELRNLQQMKPIRAYIERKTRELSEWNALLEPADASVNRRRLTNIGTFRAYVESYLKAHSLLRQDMTMIVRQLPPEANGLPIEIYCFTDTIAWVAYEAIQSDIFDHLYGVLPEFGLAVFQAPSGSDFRTLSASEEA